MPFFNAPKPFNMGVTHLRKTCDEGFEFVKIIMDTAKQVPFIDVSFPNARD